MGINYVFAKLPRVFRTKRCALIVYAVIHMRGFHVKQTVFTFRPY